VYHNHASSAQPKGILKYLISLRVALSTAKISWIRDFVENGKSISCLAGVLDSVLVSKRDLYLARAQGVTSPTGAELDEDIKAECLKCLRILLNTEPGFVAVLTSQMIVSKIALCLHSANDRIRTTVAEILAAIIVLSGDHGHKMVLVAMQDFKAFYNEQAKFEYLVKTIISDEHAGGIRFSDGTNPLTAFDYKTTAMSLVNAIVTAPDDLDVRMQLREELGRRGLTADAMAKMRKNAPAALITQIDLFEEEKREDLKEAESLVASNGVNIK
jgi:hypothetical protein